MKATKRRTASAKSTAIVRTPKAEPPTVAEAVEKVLITGDLSPLTAEQRLEYYNAVCKSLGLNPLTHPFAYILFRGNQNAPPKLALYALKDCTEQLRKMHGVSVTRSESRKEGELLIVSVEVCDRFGRTDCATGVVDLLGKQGKDLANEIMKAETKAKRRATLSVCGMGFLDESELDTMSNYNLLTPGGRVIEQPEAQGSFAAAQAVGQRIIEKKKKQIADRRANEHGSGTGTVVPQERYADGKLAGGPDDVAHSEGIAGNAVRGDSQSSASPTKQSEREAHLPPADAQTRANPECIYQETTPKSLGAHGKVANPALVGSSMDVPRPKTEAAYDAKAAAAVKGKTVKIYPLSIGGIAAWAFQPEPIEPLAYLLERGLKDIAVFASGAKRWYIVDDQAVLSAVRKVAAEFGITIEAVTGPGPMAPPAAQVPPSGVKAAPEPPPTAGTATIQSAEAVSTASNRIYLKVLFGGQLHACWNKKGWEAITASIGQSAEFVVEAKGQYRNIVGIKRIGKREYEGWEPVRTLDDMGQPSFF